MASIHSILQDSEGYMWYATEGGGLCRDDGYYIDVFRPTETENLQAASCIHCMTEDAKGNIYFGTNDGLFFVDKHDYTIHRYELSNSGRSSIDALYTDSDKSVWVGTTGLIVCIDSIGNQRHYPCEIKGKDTTVASFYEDNAKSCYALLWATHQEDSKPDIIMKSKGEKTFKSINWPLPTTPLTMTEDSQNHCFWVLTSGSGIVKMTLTDKNCKVEEQNTFIGNNIQSHGLHMIRDHRQGFLWCTSSDNLYAYIIGSDGVLHPYPLDDILPEGKKILDQMYESQDGTIYVSGYTPGTFTIKSDHQSILRHTAPAIRRMTGYPLLTDRCIKDGNYLWIWQGRQGLILYDTESDKATISPLKTDRTLTKRNSGGIWASQGETVYHFEELNGRIQYKEIAKCDTPVCLLHEDNESVLWIATETTLYRLPFIGQSLEEVCHLPDKPLDIDTDKQGHAYLAIGNKGLYSFSVQKGLKRIDSTKESFLSVSGSDDGTIWSSTFEGNVYHYLPSSNSLEKDEFISNKEGISITSIKADGIGHIWTMSNQQIREYFPKTKSFRTIRNTDPFIDVSYFYTLESIDQTHIGIDGAGAYIEIQSSSELNQDSLSNVLPLISSVIINQQKKYVGSDVEQLSLSANEEDMEIRLTTLCHQHTSSISFAYKLKGINNDWIYLPQGTSSIILSNIPKGNHILEVIATDEHGCWSKPTDLITIYRAYHWWESWWAYLLYLVIGVGVIYGIWKIERRINLLHRLIRRRQEVRLDEIEMKREDISEQLRDDEFLRNAISNIEKNLNKIDYNVEALSGDMCMSRITLYRRLQEQTGQSPTEFIRDIRLKKAAHLLLHHQDSTISDISRKVGFASPKYFSRCFKEKFGVLPKDYKGQ